MVFRSIAVRSNLLRQRTLLVAVGAFLVTGCVEEPKPRSYQEFMEDPIARDGTLLRCNQDREGTAGDLGCVNARRAASTSAARAAAARAEQLEAESDIQREALRNRVGVQQLAALRAAEEAKRVEEASYDAQWTNESQTSNPVAGSSVGAPIPAPPLATGQPEIGQLSSVSPERQHPEEPGITERDRLSYIEMPLIESPVTKALAELKLPPIATRRELQPQLEVLTISPRPRYPEGN